MKLGRNDPCHCGSGKKYKKCCLEKDEAAALARQEQTLEYDENFDDSEDVEFQPGDSAPTVPAPKDKNQMDLGRFDFFNPQPYKAAATFEILPFWLRFLETHQFLSAPLHEKTLHELRQLAAHLYEVLRKMSADPALHAATNIGDENAKAVARS